uniref:Nucleolar protein 16 n=1 Tax=Poecilia reticulata TaxID=8081 RepID=A0A3P9PBP6_POERE
MPKTKQSKRRKRFDYNTDRKKLKKKFLKKTNPRIEHAQIRNAWDNNKSMARNLQEMGLSFDPNRTLPIKKQTLVGGDTDDRRPAHIVTKPYILTKLQEEASLQEKDSKTLSSDLIEYVQHMIREHKDNYKMFLNRRSCSFQMDSHQWFCVCLHWKHQHFFVLKSFHRLFILDSEP